MKSKNIVIGGFLSGAVFYIISLLTWALFKFLPIIPLSIAVPESGLQQGWALVHLIVSVLIGFIWVWGYVVYGMKRPGGWLYGSVMYLVGTLPAFIVHFMMNAPLRGIIFYGAVISFIGALLGGRVISSIVKR
jgi:hypothetical protein